MTHQRILIIHKGGHVHTWCEDLRLGFQELGHHAISIAMRDRTLQERLLERRDGLRLLANPLTIERIAQTIQCHRPHLVVCLNQHGLPDHAHAALRKAAAGAPIVAWLADHILTIPSDHKPNLDAIYAFDSATLPLLRQHYYDTSTHISFLPLAVNLQRFRDSALPWAARRPGLVFVGNHTPDRLSLIHQLQSSGASIACYGPRATTSWHIWRRRRVTPAATAKLYGAHRAVLNMLQFPNTIHGVNLRAYEIPACGGIGTYPLTPDLPLSFEPNEEVIAYRDLPDLAAQIEALTPVKMQSLLRLSQKRVLAEHMYAHRASSILADL